ncbi:MAG: hypothetical protein PHC50_07800 [Candidatus Cloacimonetes bacterium]|nr:hypothetical protein [Candidatus Cloacimonadota bacterium]
MNKRRQVFENTLWAIIQIREKETLEKRVLEDLCVLEKYTNRAFYEIKTIKKPNIIPISLFIKRALNVLFSICSEVFCVSDLHNFLNNNTLLTRSILS